MRYRSLALLAIVAFAIACASTNTAQRPANVSRPDIDAELAERRQERTEHAGVLPGEVVE